jgi:hypothetical protein
MDSSKRIFAVRDVSRVLIAFGILIMVLNLNFYPLVYIFGIITMIIGFINLFSLKPQIKLYGAINMVLVGIYFLLTPFIFYYHIYGFLGVLVMAAMSLILIALSLRYIFYHLKQNS